MNASITLAFYRFPAAAKRVTLKNINGHSLTFPSYDEESFI
jgi:hypothetical protein